MARTMSFVVVLALALAAPSLASAQRFPFERTIAATGPVRLDVATIRGKIQVSAGEPGRVTVAGDVTVRAGWNVPVNAAEIAQRIAAAPPIEHTGTTLRAFVPPDRTAQQAVTVSFRITVPPDADVQTVTSSGETSVHGVKGSVSVKTQSAAIDLGDLSGTVQIDTGSGAVEVEAISGPLSVTTASSSFTGSRLGSSLRVRTQSGAVKASFNGSADVQVDTGSSGIDLRGVRGALLVKTGSGRVTVSGTPLRDWTVTTSSSAVALTLEPDAAFAIDAASRSGDVTVEGMTVDGSSRKHAVQGTVGEGGPTIRIRSGSGAIRLRGDGR